MMKTIFATMTALAALSVAAPASAQPWRAHGTQSGALQIQIDAGVRDGAISRRELTPLRESLRRLVGLERAFARNGISRTEHATLQQRGTTLRRQIVLAERSGPTGRFGANDLKERSDRGDQYADTRFDRPNRGDRFTGDVRIGQRYSARMIALPTELRSEYRDSDDVYYRYDEERIYQVDRRTNLILRLLDLPK